MRRKVPSLTHALNDSLVPQVPATNSHSAIFGQVENVATKKLRYVRLIDR